MKDLEKFFERKPEKSGGHGGRVGGEGSTIETKICCLWTELPSPVVFFVSRVVAMAAEDHDIALVPQKKCSTRP